MSHLGSSFQSYNSFLEGADAFYTADLIALNSSGVSGNVLLALQTNEDGTGYINVAVSAEGLAPDQVHIQHVHGLFDDQGNPANSQTPTIASDTDRDGVVEVLEGLANYGDILLPIQTPDGVSPMADQQGGLAFVQSFAIEDAANFFSPVTGNDYSFDDLIDVALREYVIHGLTIPAGLGNGTPGEVNGAGGYIPILPAAAAEFEQVTQAQAFDILAQATLDARSTTYLDGSDNVLNTGAGDDVVFAGRGNDQIDGGGDNDVLFGQDGDDLLRGGSGDDTLIGAEGADTLRGGDGDDRLDGGNSDDLITADAGDDLLLGRNGDDMLFGAAGDDVIAGGDGADQLNGGSGDDLLNGGSGNDGLLGGDGDDTMLGGAGDDAMWGGDGEDVMAGGAGDDTMNGNAGDDILSGGAGDDFLRGGSGDDKIGGGAGDDLLVGGTGDDTMNGGDGADIFGGQGGNDILTGGFGNDEFHFDAGTGTDRITDFAQGEDVISFLNNGAVSFANSSTNEMRGTSDLSTLDFDTIMSIDELDMANDQQVVYLTSTMENLSLVTGASVEAYIAASDGQNTMIAYDDNWSDIEGREIISVLTDFNAQMSVADFDVY